MSKRKIDWQKEMRIAERQLSRNKQAIDFTVKGTPSSWSRAGYNKPLVAPDPSAPDTKIVSKRLNKKQRKKHNKKFVPEQKRKAKVSNENEGLPIVKKI